MRRLILRSFQSPGDVVVLTAAIRDLHRAYPGQFQTDVRTSADALFLHNPYITQLQEQEYGVEVFDMHYPAIHQSNERPYHFLHGFPQYLEQLLGVRIPVTRFSGDIYLSAEEKLHAPPGVDHDLPEPFWIVMAGGKYDFTAKWWNPASYQAVVDHFQGKLTFVQCGEAGHWHPPLTGVINLVGKTSTRDFIRLMYHADGVLCPVTFAMHLAAAVETKPGRPPHRACVVLAGGREPPHWEAYPHHQFLSNVGTLSCCAQGGCWKSRCQTVGDGDAKDHHELCLAPIQVAADLRIPQCLHLITPEQVIDRIEMYYRGGFRRFYDGGKPLEISPVPSLVVPSSPAAVPPGGPTFVSTKPGCCGQAPPGDRFRKLSSTARVLFTFTHGLGDAIQFTCVLQHIQRYFPGWKVDVWSLQGKHSAFHGLCRNSLDDRCNEPDAKHYDAVHDVEWHEAEQPYAGVPSTKVSRFLREEFGIQPDPDLFRYQIQISPAAREAARGYLSRIVELAGLGVVDGTRFPVLLLHYQGNTSQASKNLSHETAFSICRAAQGAGLVPVILDWDHRSPWPDQATIFCPGADDPLWGQTGTGDAERLAALIDLSAMMIGIDSGPLHVAGATSTPTLGLWTRHFPGKYFDLCDNVTHLVPDAWRELPLASNPDASEFFLRKYRYQIYHDLETTLLETIVDRVQGVIPAGRTPPDSSLVRYGEFWIRKDNVAQDLVIVRDIFEQDAYRTQLLADNAGPNEVVVDIGAHIGTFARQWHRKNPRAKIVCVEACPENLTALHANVGDFATVVHAACTYESGRMALLNAVRPNCESTGGSVVVPEEELATTALKQDGYKYWEDHRALPKVTLEQLLEELELDHIDILKLDCEGSEYSILGHTSSLGRIRYIVGEYHQRSRWDVFRSERLAHWDYGQMLDGGENGGLFHYANPQYASTAASPASLRPGDEPSVTPLRSAGATGSRESDLISPCDSPTKAFLDHLAAHLAPRDRPLWSAWRPYYLALYEIAARLQPNSVVELGTRAGYSALTFLTAVPGSQVTSYDAAAESDSLELLAHAATLLAGHDCRLIRADSLGLDRLPTCELVYVDGDHSVTGCVNDLRLAARSSDTILVDDFGTNLNVRQAVTSFLESVPGVFQTEEIPFTFGGDLGSGSFLLLQRLHRPQPVQPLLCPPRLRVAIPAGIGDAVWSLMKIPHLLRIYGADQVEIGLCGPPPYRSLPFVERFDFVSSAEYSRWQCVEANPFTPEGVYNWAPSGVGWHHEFDWMLQANRHLESGQRLETWLPEYETDWGIADRFRFLASELRVAREFAAAHGPYCVLYLGPEAGNTVAGHNRGALWTPEEWGRLAESCRRLGLKVVVVGASYDRPYLERHVAPHLGDFVDRCGGWGIGQTFAIIQRSQFVIAYQSGIGIFSVYLGIPTACFWRPQGDSITTAGYVSFDERMASAWAPRDALASGRYLPLIYTQCSPETITEHIVTHEWSRA